MDSVLATVSDKKIGVFLEPSSTEEGYYTADVLTSNVCTPFGMLMQGRKFTAGTSYRYGFNGKENDNEVKGEGNQQDYGFRIYDPRLGRFISIDPLKDKYPWNTPYTYAENNPILYKDIDGLEKIHYQRTWNNGKAVLTYLNTEHFSEWQWRPKMGGTSLGFQLWQKVKDPRLEFVVHQQRVGTIEKFDKVQFVTYDETWTFSNYSNLIQNKNGEYGSELAKFYLGKGAQNAKEENMANGGAGMFVNLTGGKLGGAIAKTGLQAEAIVARGISGVTYTESSLTKALTASSEDMITLFRGVSGSEKSTGALFLTDDAAYASSYSKNVVKYQISRGGFNQLKNEGLIETLQGVNKSTGAKGLEFKVSNQIIKNQILKSEVSK